MGKFARGFAQGFTPAFIQSWQNAQQRYAREKAWKQQLDLYEKQRKDRQADWESQQIFKWKNAPPQRKTQFEVETASTQNALYRRIDELWENWKTGGTMTLGASPTGEMLTFTPKDYETPEQAFHMLMAKTVPGAVVEEAPTKEALYEKLGVSGFDMFMQKYPDMGIRENIGKTGFVAVKKHISYQHRFANKETQLEPLMYRGLDYLKGKQAMSPEGPVYGPSPPLPSGPGAKARMGPEQDASTGGFGSQDVPRGFEPGVAGAEVPAAAAPEATRPAPARLSNRQLFRMAENFPYIRRGGSGPLAAERISQKAGDRMVYAVREMDRQLSAGSITLDEAAKRFRENFPDTLGRFFPHDQTKDMIQQRMDILKQEGSKFFDPETDDDYQRYAGGWFYRGRFPGAGPPGSQSEMEYKLRKWGFNNMEEFKKFLEEEKKATRK